MEILFAYFGAEPDYFDVTSRIRQSLKDGMLKGKVYTHKHLGDPAPRKSKVLTIYYSHNFKICKAEFPEMPPKRQMKVDLPQ